MSLREIAGEFSSPATCSCWKPWLLCRCSVVVLFCSALLLVFFVSARKAVWYCVNVAKPRPKRQKSLEPAKEKTEQQCLIINKKIIWTVSFHLRRAWIFENATATFSWTGLPLEVDQFSMVSTLSIFICGTFVFFCGWLEKSQKSEPAKILCQTVFKTDLLDNAILKFWLA